MKNWFRRRDRASEIHEEVESHIGMREEFNRAAGMSPARRIPALAASSATPR